MNSTHLPIALKIKKENNKSYLPEMDIKIKLLESEKYNLNSFQDFLINAKGIAKKNSSFYQLWVNKFLSFYQKELKHQR